MSYVYEECIRGFEKWVTYAVKLLILYEVRVVNMACFQEAYMPLPKFLTVLNSLPDTYNNGF